MPLVVLPIGRKRDREREPFWARSRYMIERSAAFDCAF